MFTNDFRARLWYTRRLMKILKKKDWPISLAYEFGLIKKREYICTLSNGIKYHVRPGTLDVKVITETWFEGCYTPPGFEIGKEDIVVDVGGHIGTFSVFASMQAIRGKIYVFEPYPKNYEILKDNISLNNIKNAILFNKAISKSSGQMELFISENSSNGRTSEYNTGGHSFYPELTGVEKAKKISVSTISLQEFIEQNSISRIDFLKMDCEGGEYESLFNSPNSILRKIQKVSMEYHNIDDNHNVTVLKKFLMEKGFDIKSIERMGSIGMLYAKRLQGNDNRKDN